MTQTALFDKIQARDPTVVPAWKVLCMATIEGAQAVGLGDEVGSPEAGKQAEPTRHTTGDATANEHQGIRLYRNQLGWVHRQT
jgi:hypothetical protein